MDIRNSVVLITSAGTVLGSTLANHFAALGATVIATDTDKESLEKTALHCQPHTEKLFLYHLADYSFESVQSLFKNVEQTLNENIDILVNYWPGSPFPSLFNSKSEDDLSQSMCSLACPFFSFGQASAEHMRNKHKNGIIINMVTYEDQQNKAGIENTSSMISGFTKSWAKELDPFNIRVGGVIPTLSSHTTHEESIVHWAQLQDELIRSTEYIVSNEYFNGRIMAA